jgi:manganese transport protein
MIALVLFTRRRDIMGEFASGPLIQAATVLGAAIVLALNFVLLAQAIGLPIPFLAPS